MQCSCCVIDEEVPGVGCREVKDHFERCGGGGVFERRSQTKRFLGANDVARETDTTSSRH